VLCCPVEAAAAAALASVVLRICTAVWCSHAEATPPPTMPQ
jgi:hypothetical protein